MKKITTAMAMSRSVFKNRLRNMISGALGEYAKMRFAALVGGVGYDWEPEVKRLCATITDFIRDQTITGNPSKAGVLVEAITEASFSQDKLTKAKNQVFKFVDPGKRHLLQRAGFESSVLIGEMMGKYMPKLMRVK